MGVGRTWADDTGHVASGRMGVLSRETEARAQPLRLWKGLVRTLGGILLLSLEKELY